MRAILTALFLCVFSSLTQASPLERASIAEMIMPPFSLGDPVNEKGVYSLLNSGGAQAGYVFQTAPLAPLPGFSGAPINILVVLDLEGKFLDVRLISQNEPIFVSGLGEAPFHKFFEQYHGLSMSSSIVVGTPYGGGGEGTSLIYLDGVTKATASVRIAHESVMAAALSVARQKMQGIATTPPAYPNRAHRESLTWADLVSQGIASRLIVTNGEIDAAYAGTLWEDDDPEARAFPDKTYLDLWIVDLGPPSIARAVLSKQGFDELQGFLNISPDEEPLLVIDTARHGLVSPDFVRNTAPDWLSAEQDGLPVALRDSDLLVDLSPQLPETMHEGTAMILRVDRRLGFDPARDWTLNVAAIRKHGIFQPETGSVLLPLTHRTDQRFFLRPEAVAPTPPWLDALRARQGDIVVLTLFLTGLSALMMRKSSVLTQSRSLTPVRLLVLAVMTVFVGWWGQGQLSIVTVLGVIRATFQGGSFAFLAYDPFSLLIWAFTILGFVLWGRGFFCGWLCPFGALQEFADHLGRRLRLPRIEPSQAWDQRLKLLKYGLLGGLVLLVFIAPDHVDQAVEIEPFKTAITTFFVREWYYVAYAVAVLAYGMFMFKGFCRYICPLGAFMAIGGMLRGRTWIARRAECGSPCQLCKARCSYGAIRKSGEIRYSECFGCMDCVATHQDETRCVPLIIAARRHTKQEAAE